MYTYLIEKAGFTFTLQLTYKQYLQAAYRKNVVFLQM